MILALWHFKYRFLLFLSFFLVYISANFALASYQKTSLQDDRYLLPPLQDKQTTEGTACHYSPDLLDIEIGKVNLSTQEEDIFQFYVEMSDLQVDPSHLSYTWVVESPSNSMNPQTILDYRLTLKPEKWGTYRITLVLEDGFQNCKYTVYIFQYPKIDSDDLEFVPSIHALFQEAWIF